MFDIETIIKKYTGEDGSIPSNAVSKLAQEVKSSVGREFIEKARYTEKLEEVETLKTEKQAAEDSATTASKWQDKYNTLEQEFENYKGEQSAKETRAAKEAAVRAYYQSKNITGKALDIAMRGSREEIEALELTDGKIKDTKALDELVSGDFSGLVSVTTTTGAPVAHPPRNTGGSLTKADIFKKDEKGRYVMDTTDRQNALAKMMSEKTN